MRVVLLAALIICVGFISAAGEPWQEPEDFRGLKWGASVQEMQKLYPKES